LIVITNEFIFSRSRSGSAGRRKRSPTPKPTKVHVAHLTRNVTQEHIAEIFGFFGSIKSVDFPTERSKSWLGTGTAYVDFEKPEMAEEAKMKMNEGQLKLIYSSFFASSEAK
jgi:RNA-binding protein with serine-rich domain 1